MKKIFKKSVAWAMTLCMIVALMPAMVFAAPASYKLTEVTISNFAELLSNANFDTALTDETIESAIRSVPGQTATEQSDSRIIWQVYDASENMFWAAIFQSNTFFFIQSITEAEAIESMDIYNAKIYVLELDTRSGFKPVTGITGVPATATVGTALALTGTVAPSDATNKTITWSVASQGTTGETTTAPSGFSVTKANDLITITTTNAANAGKYYFKVTATKGEQTATSQVATVTINKIDYTANKTVSTTVLNTGTENATVSILQLPQGASYGTPVASGDLKVTAMSVTNNVLTYTSPSTVVGISGTVTIPVTGATNYNDYNVVVTIVTIAKKAQNISYATNLVSKTYGDAKFTNPLTQTTVVGAITYASNNQNVATVNANGEITVVGYGKATITATAAETSTHAKATATYDVMVNKKELTVTPVNATMYYAHTMPKLTFTYSGFVNGDNANNSFTANTLHVTTSANGTQVGTFATQIAGEITSNNYKLATQQGTLTVLDRALTGAVSTMPQQPSGKALVAVPNSSLPVGATLDQLRLAVSYEVTSADKANLNSAVNGKSAFANKMYTEISLIHNDVSVQPTGAITIFIPYPTGTNKNNNFTVMHIKTAGGTETITPTKLDNGISFTVTPYRHSQLAGLTNQLLAQAAKL